MTDCYTKLRMEFAVLQELLKDGIFKERINGILAVLKEAIDNKDGQLILYCLENILKWYADNIESITENYFMYCESDYLDNYDKLTETSLDKGTQRKTTENELPSLTQCTA